MKKSLLFLVCCLGVVFKGKTQTYYPMLGNSIAWYISTEFEGCHTDIYTISTDTIINGSQYKIVIGYQYTVQPSPIVFLREDTLQKKVYARLAGSALTAPIDTFETVYYDFNLQTGDSIFLLDPGINRGQMDRFDTIGWYMVDSISSINISVGARKIFFLSHYVSDHGFFSQRYMNWIEGIGAVKVFDSYLIENGYSFSWLSCSFRDSVKQYQGVGYYSNDTFCFCNISGINEIDKNPFSLYPNPATNQLNISIDESLIGAQLNIYNITGALVQTVLLSTANSQLSTGNLPNGVYIAEIKTKEARVIRRWVKM